MPTGGLVKHAVMEVIGTIQVFSDKSYTSLCANATDFIFLM